MTIFYSCNSNYINQTMISIYSVMKYHREAVKFLVVGDRLSFTEKNRIQKLVERGGSLIRFIEMDWIIELRELITDGQHPKSVYAKLFPEQLTEEKRILYLDSDIVANAAFSELFSMDLQGAIIAGVRMPYSQVVLKRQRIEGEIFICDGIVLIDVEQWRKQQLSQKAMAYIHSYRGKPERMSESVINYICAGQILVLPPCYNLMPQFLVFRAWELEKMHRITGYYSEEELEEARKRPILIHFMRELYIRPWYKSQDVRWNHPYHGLYEKYQKKLGISLIKKGKLSVRTKVLRRLYEKLPFSIFLAIFWLFHRD